MHDMATLASDASTLLIEAVEQTPRENWYMASNLDGWTVRDLIAHVTGSATKIVTLIEGGALWGRSEPADWMVDNPAEVLRDLRRRMVESLPDADVDAPRRTPQQDGDVPLRSALAYPISDLAIHAWDLHRSQGRLVDLPDRVLAFISGLVESVPEDILRRPGGFGPQQDVPDGASPTTKLMAFLGRAVG
ncbi:MAG: TIGR03086 family protein [Nocardia sp.]|nr:TIGR03086 family protein [Nocardia sp.]